MKGIDLVKNRFPGVLISICDSNGDFQHYSQGFAQIEKKEPLTENHLFQCGRITCIFTATILLQIADDGLLDIDMPLHRLAQSYQKDGGRLKLLVDLYSILKPVSVRELLNHTSGLPSYNKTLAYQEIFFNSPKKVWKIENYLDLITDPNAEFKLYYTLPGRGKFSVSATDYVIAGLVIEAVTGYKSSYWMNELYAQTGLKSTFYSKYGKLNNELLPRMAHGYLPLSHSYAGAFHKLPTISLYGNRRYRVIDVTSAYNFNGLGGSASLSSTTDLIHFLRQLLHKKIIYHHYNEIHNGVVVPSVSPDQSEIHHWGFGVYKTLMRDYGDIVWAVGNNFGYAVIVIHAIKYNISIAIAINATYAPFNPQLQLVKYVLRDVLA